MKIGDRVKPSAYAVRSDQEYMYKWNTGSSQRSGAERYLAKRLAVRGTVTALRPADKSRGKANGIEVTEDSGVVSHALPYMWEIVENES